MNQKQIKVTEEGLQLLQERIVKQEQLVKDIQAEKAIAYTASGDGWHDNPGFNALEQKEYAAASELSSLISRRENAIVIKIDPRNTDVIQIGSIVKLEHLNTKIEKNRFLTWEIVGHLESDIKKFKIAYDTPIGSAIIGKKVGEDVDVKLPAGMARYRITKLYGSWEDTRK
jgi:transcription elongation GreA/GreB family factor